MHAHAPYCNRVSPRHTARVPTPHSSSPQLIMAPEFNRRLRLGDETAVAARGAYDTGLAACFLLGSLEMLALPFVDSIRKLIPRAAMLAAIAGVSLTFIAMGFAVQALHRHSARATPARAFTHSCAHAACIHTLCSCA